LSRGFLFAVAAVRLRLSARSSSQARVMRWWRQARLLLHVHGVGPRIGGIDLRLLRNVTWPPAGDPVWELTRRYLNSAFLTLGCGDHPVATEIHLAAAMLRAAFSLAAMRGSGAIDLEGLELALREASDIEHNASPVLQRLLGFLADGSNPLRAIASGKPV
jgi:hypothetical protein